METLTAQILRTLRHALWLIVLVSVLLPMLDVLVGRGQTRVWTLVPYLLLVYTFHRIALFGRAAAWGRPADAGPEVPRESFIRFLMVSLLFVVVALGAGLAAGLVVAPGGAQAMPMLPATMLGVAVLLAWPGLAIFGTLLPAAAAGQPLAPRRALAAARLTAATLAWQLPLLTGVSFALLLLLAQWAAPLILPFGMSGPATLLVEMLFTALGFLPSLVTAVLLSRAYARGWPRD